MGNEQSSEIQQLTVINHHRFKTGRVTENDCIEVCMEINNQTDFYQWEKSLNQITFVDDQVFLLPKAYQFQKKSVCGSAGRLKLEYDNFPYILTHQTQNRAPYEKHFQEQQLWYLLYSLVTSSYIFSIINKRVGDIRPDNIFINDQGQVKVSSVYSWPNEPTNFQKTLLDRQITYISPEEIAQCRLSKLQTVLNKSLGESFSIGLTLLHCALLKSMNILYNTFYFTFNQLQLAQFTNQLLNIKFKSENNNIVTYSNPLKEAIIGLCQTDPKFRVSSQLIYNWLHPFDSQIANFKPFNISKPPILRDYLSKIQRNQSATKNYIQNQNKNQNINFQRHLVNSQGLKPSHTIIQHNPTMQMNISPNTQQNIKKINCRTNLQPNLQQNLQPNIKPNLQPNIKPNLQPNLHPNLQVRGNHLHYNNYVVNPVIKNVEGHKSVPKTQYLQNQGNKFSNYNLPVKSIYDSQGSSTTTNDIFKRIDEQLMRSKQLFP